MWPWLSLGSVNGEIVECSSLDGWVTSIRSLASLQWASRKRRGENSLNNPSIEGRTDLRSTDPCVRCDPPSQINELSSAATLAGKVEEGAAEERFSSLLSNQALDSSTALLLSPTYTQTECTSILEPEKKRAHTDPLLASIALIIEALACAAVKNEISHNISNF